MSAKEMEEIIREAAEIRLQAEAIARKALRIEHLRVCARMDCGNVFLKRTRGIFCSPRCSQLQRTRRFEGSLSKEDLATRRRKYYLNRKKKV